MSDRAKEEKLAKTKKAGQEKQNSYWNLQNRKEFLHTKEYTGSY